MMSARGPSPCQYARLAKAWMVARPILTNMVPNTFEIHDQGAFAGTGGLRYNPPSGAA